jgi:hypothetical protein
MLFTVDATAQASLERRRCPWAATPLSRHVAASINFRAVNTADMRERERFGGKDAAQ